MDWMYLFYFLLSSLLFGGAAVCRPKAWNEEYTSLKQTQILKGVCVLGVALHHMAQKTCAPWNEEKYIVHGLDLFVPMGYLFVAVFLFCSGLGLYKSWKTRPDYLRVFPRRRILPMVLAFYLSEIIYTLVRLAVGEQMDTATVLRYLSGFQMANYNAWYQIVIPFFYLVFYLSFRFCRRDGAAIGWVILFTLAYTLLGASRDHQGEGWVRGEWWYNSIILFPLGMVFGKYEARVTAFLKKRYWFWLLLSFIAVFALYRISVLASDRWWGYYGENWGDPLKVPHRLGCCVSQWLVCVAFVAFWFLLLMKVRLGNQLLAVLGSATLSFYLIHGMFVDLFGFNFAGVAPSAVYIRSVPLYILAVLSCSALGSALFHFLWKGLVKLTGCGKSAA